MEEKINNQKIFRYVPSLIARLIINSNLQDKDIFFDEKIDQSKLLRYSIIPKSKGRCTFLAMTSNINTNLYPITHFIENTLVMNIRLKGFQKLITTLSLNDPKGQKEKMISEYLSIITPKLLLKISNIISNNGGEIIKYNDNEFTTIWYFTPSKKGLLQRFQKYYAKQAILTACQIMKEVDGTEIACGIKVKISIGIAMGETSIVFFGGERKRGEYIVMGKTIQRAEICLNYCFDHEIIISQEINDLFIGSEEIYTKEVNNEENLKIFVITHFAENLLKNFRGFKIKMKYDKLKLTKTVYENISKKVYIFSSILPQGLVKYLDVDQDQNLKEISVVTISTIHILLNPNIKNNLKKIQNIILDIQKATYLTFGSLLYISKTYNGFLIRCVWGMDPGSFLDDTARAIATAILIGKLTEHYEIRIGIGISTGSCYTGLIALQGDRKQFTLLGKKVNLSRTLADEAFRKILDPNNKRKYCIYCDQTTKKQSQKWYRHIYRSDLKFTISKNSQDLYFDAKDDFSLGRNNYKTTYNKNNNNAFKFLKDIKKDLKKNLEKKKTHLRFKSYDKRTRRNISLFSEYAQKNKTYFRNDSGIDEESFDDQVQIIKAKYYSPVEAEEYFIPSYYDTFPLIRTHKHNSYSPKIKQYFSNHFDNFSIRNIINCHGIANLPILIQCSQQEENKMNYKFNKSITIFGKDNEIKKFVNIMNKVTENNIKQTLLIRGPLGTGKSLFLRKVLNQYLDNNEDLKSIHLNEDEFIFCNKIDPLITTFPYNTFCFIFRKIFLHLKRLKLLKALNEKTKNIKLDSENIKNINFMLSIGKKDININEEFERVSEEVDLLKLFKNKNKDNSKSTRDVLGFSSRNFSVINELEGPHKVKDLNKINFFFYEMIKIYKNYLNNKYKDKNINKNKVPLIFVIDDVQISDKYSIEFIKNLFNKRDKNNDPFIIIMAEQTPFNKNYSPLSHRELEYFLSSFIEFDENIGSDKIICFEMKPFFEKNILKDILIENFNKYIIQNYDTELKVIDDRILDFLIMKSFQGNPLLIISLFETFLKSQKYIQILENESKCEITQELLDDNEVFDWSSLLIPYIYEKLTSIMINNLLTFKEALLLKYACTIGTFFDIQTLDKINPLNLIIKREDLYNIMQKLCDEYVIEVFGDEQLIKKSKKFLICKICFPFMREVLNQKFPIERRASLHAEAAKLLTGSQKIFYFNYKIEGKILRRHLIYSEINVVNEIESSIGKNSIVEECKNNQIMNLGNLTLLFVKEIIARIFDRKNKNVLEGKLEMKIGFTWVNVSYFIDRTWKLYFNRKKNNEEEIELKVPIKDIYKNTKLNDGKVLELIIAEYSFFIQNKIKNKYYFQSDNWYDIFQLDTAISFLRVIANFEKYNYNFGYTQLPLYKPGWYAKKEKKYYANLEKNQRAYYGTLISSRTKRLLSSYGLDNRTDKILNESKDVKKIFVSLMHTTFTLLLAKIQFNLQKDYTLNNEDEENQIQGNMFYLIYIPTTPHVSTPIKKYLEDYAHKEKEEEDLKKMRDKNKYSFLPLSLLKEERRILGCGVESKKRHLSISEIKTFLINREDRKQKKHLTYKEFVGRKKDKSKTILERSEIPKEIKERIKSEASIEFVDNIDNDSESQKSKSFENSDQSFNFSDSSERSESPIKLDKVDKLDDLRYSINIKKYKNKNKKDDKEKPKEKKKESEFKKKINNIKNIKNMSYTNNFSNKSNHINNKMNTRNSDLSLESDNNKEENNNDSKENNFNLNDLIIANNNNNSNNTQTNRNNQQNNNSNNNYNINNYINNNININVVNNNFLNVTLKSSFIKNRLLQNYYNRAKKIDTRMSYHKREYKFKPKSNSCVVMKKNNSDQIKSSKEKYLNNIINYYNSSSSHKVSINESDEDSLFSDKETDNNKSNNNEATNIFVTPETKKKKGSKVSTGTFIIKDDDFFSKVLLAILGEDNIDILFPMEENQFNLLNNCINNNNEDINKKDNKENNSFKCMKSCKIAEPKDLKTKPVEIKKKRSSLMPAFRDRKKNKHVTFSQKKSDLSNVLFQESLFRNSNPKNNIININYKDKYKKYNSRFSKNG